MADDTEQARVLYQKANTNFKNGDDVMAREYYRQSWVLHESFDTICNYARSEARSKIFDGAYEKLGLCLYLYPKDPELAANKQKFAELREEVRLQIDVDEQEEIDARLKQEIDRREKEAALLAAPDSGLGGPEPAPRYSPYRVPVSAGVAGLGVVGLGVGVGFLVHSGVKKGRAEDLSGEIADDSGFCGGSTPDSRCQELKNLSESSESASQVAVGSFIAGGALLVGGALTYFLWPTSKVAETARPVITFDRETAEWSFGLQGQF